VPLARANRHVCLDLIVSYRPRNPQCRGPQSGPAAARRDVAEVPETDRQDLARLLEHSRHEMERMAEQLAQEMGDARSKHSNSDSETAPTGA
jgi:CRP-like cAMP-binding protein